MSVYVCVCVSLLTLLRIFFRFLSFVCLEHNRGCEKDLFFLFFTQKKCSLIIIFFLLENLIQHVHSYYFACFSIQLLFNIAFFLLLLLLFTTCSCTTMNHKTVGHKRSWLCFLSCFSWVYPSTYPTVYLVALLVLLCFALSLTHTHTHTLQIQSTVHVVPHIPLHSTVARRNLLSFHHDMHFHFRRFPIAVQHDSHLLSFHSQHIL